MAAPKVSWAATGAEMSAVWVVEVGADRADIDAIGVEMGAWGGLVDEGGVDGDGDRAEVGPSGVHGDGGGVEVGDACVEGSERVGEGKSARVD